MAQTEGNASLRDVVRSVAWLPRGLGWLGAAVTHFPRDAVLRRATIRVASSVFWTCLPLVLVVAIPLGAWLGALGTSGRSALAARTMGPFLLQFVPALVTTLVGLRWVGLATIFIARRTLDGEATDARSVVLGCAGALPALIAWTYVGLFIGAVSHSTLAGSWGGPTELILYATAQVQPVTVTAAIIGGSAFGAVLGAAIADVGQQARSTTELSRLPWRAFARGLGTIACMIAIVRYIEFVL